VIRRAALALAALLLLAGCSSGRSSDAAPSTVDTTSGNLQGTVTDTARQFLGVRYAEAPTGDRRWTDPVAPPKPAGTVDATKAGPSCAQAGSAPGADATASTSEDCLFLNVTTPKDLHPGEKLPVMVWWHGGGYTSGSGAAYDAQRLAAGGRVMVVTVNYRLGVFGYLSLPGLAGSGDFGLADQILATRWARDNAAAFGGDPQNLTVFGESSGAMSACAALTSPAAAGLADKVALSSGSCQLSWPQDGLLPGVPPGTPYVGLPDAEQFGSAQAQTLGCTGPDALTCLRGRPVADLLKIFPNFSNVLAYGTPLLPADPAQAQRDGKTPPIPVLSGGNQAEESAFVGGVQKVQPFVTPESYPALLRSAFGDRADAVAAQYPLAAYPNAPTAWATVITDSSWACPTLAGNVAFAAHGSPVHGYEFADPSAPDVNQAASPDFAPGAAHATDTPYLFDLTGKNLLTTPEQQRLSNAMIDYWTSFARTGTPTAADAPAWPVLQDGSGPSLRLAPTIGLADLAAEHRCGFWG
jgi:para-nitrobenzyl esterase